MNKFYIPLLMYGEGGMERGRERGGILFVFIGKEDLGEQDGESQLMIGHSIAMLQVHCLLPCVILIAWLSNF